MHALTSHLEGDLVAMRSGTIAIEAAQVAVKIRPGGHRWCVFENLLPHGSHF